MRYAYEFNICKFDLKLYKLVVVNFLTVSNVLITFLEFIQNLFSFCAFFAYWLIFKIYLYFFFLKNILLRLYSLTYLLKLWLLQYISPHDATSRHVQHKISVSSKSSFPCGLPVSLLKS